MFKVAICDLKANILCLFRALVRAGNNQDFSETERKMWNYPHFGATYSLALKKLSLTGLAISFIVRIQSMRGAALVQVTCSNLGREENSHLV
jgi:hypothetical protein